MSSIDGAPREDPMKRIDGHREDAVVVESIVDRHDVRSIGAAAADDLIFR